MEISESFHLDVVSVRLVRDAPIFSDRKICHPEDAIAVVGEFLSEMDREVMCVLNLKEDGTPVNCNFASIGAVNHAIAEPRELFKSAILSNAANMILVHNHPSGNVLPSREDTMLTDRILSLTDLLGIPLLDHIIIGGSNRSYFSFKEKKMLKRPKITVIADYERLEFKNQVFAAEPKRGK